MLDNLNEFDDRILWILAAAAVMVYLLIVEVVIRAMTRRHERPWVGFRHPADQ
jgi:hypothetical protein